MPRTDEQVAVLRKYHDDLNLMARKYVRGDLGEWDKRVARSLLSRLILNAARSAVPREEWCIEERLTQIEYRLDGLEREHDQHVRRL